MRPSIAERRRPVSVSQVFCATCGVIPNSRNAMTNPACRSPCRRRASCDQPAARVARNSRQAYSDACVGGSPLRPLRHRRSGLRWVRRTRRSAPVPWPGVRGGQRYCRAVEKELPPGTSTLMDICRRSVARDGGSIRRNTSSAIPTYIYCRLSPATRVTSRVAQQQTTYQRGR